MTIIPIEIEDLTKSQPKTPPPVRLSPFALGFRPFFLGAALWAAIDIFLWLAIYRGAPIHALYFDPMTWHAHEMVFGFSSAVIAGFLLTAAKNWTGHPTPTGVPLAALFGLWAAGRIAPLCASFLPGMFIAAIDLAFLPVLILSLVPALRKGRAMNWIFPGMLVVLTASNALVHRQALGLDPISARLGLYAGIYLILLMILVMSGRVFPFFTERGIDGFKPKKNVWVNGVAIALFAALALADLFCPHPAAVAGLAVLTTIAHTLRLGGWFTPKVLGKPILWILFIGYAWIILGFLLRAGVPWGNLSPFASLHSYTAGGIGVICLGMMTRVSRGHTGRVIGTDKLAVTAFISINVAALLRVCGTLVSSNFYVWVITISAMLWGLAYALFVLGHANMLVHSRPDGKAG